MFWRRKHNLYILIFYKLDMASTPPGAKKQRIDYTVDKAVYDAFVKACSYKGFAPQVVIEKAMKSFSETGRI